MTITPDPDTGSDLIPDPAPDTNKFDTSDRAMILILAVLMMAGSAPVLRVRRETGSAELSRGGP